MHPTQYYSSKLEHMQALAETALSAKEIITQKVVLVMAQLFSVDLVMKMVSELALTMAAMLVW